MENMSRALLRMDQQIKKSHVLGANSFCLRDGLKNSLFSDILLFYCAIFYFHVSEEDFLKSKGTFLPY